MSNITVKEQEITNSIYTIRGVQVMLDSDVARLYGYETKRIIETIKRNKERFPERFCFQLTLYECDQLSNNILRSQFATSKIENVENKQDTDLKSQFVTSNLKDPRGGRRYSPYVFTEQGIAMLSGLLKNSIAIQVSINIMDAFVKMRKFISENKQVFERLINIEYKLLDYDKKFELIFDELSRESEFKHKIFFEGQIYDAYTIIIDIIKKGGYDIVIIDNYVDKSLLDMLRYKHGRVKITLITKINTLNELDIIKFNNQYHNLIIKENNTFHDRFIIIDSKYLYHIGASLKDVGKKCFAITLI